MLAGGFLDLYSQAGQPEARNANPPHWLMTVRSCTLTNPGATGSKPVRPLLHNKKSLERSIMTHWPSAPSVFRRTFVVIALAAALVGFGGAQVILPSNASAEDGTTLVLLAQLTVQKGFKNISLGDVCDRLHIGVNCKAYQLNAAIDPAEAQKFGLPAGWQTSFNVLAQRGGSNIVITGNDDHIGHAYLVGADEGWRAVIVGLSASGDGKNWRWRPGLINDETTQKFAAEKAYWLAQIKAIQALPDRKD
jgi:hypothetical protein